MSFLLNLATVLIYYCVLIFSYLGFGWIASRLLSINFIQSEKPFSLIWLGWAVALLLLQILNVFVPIAAIVSILLLLAGLILALVFLKMNFKELDAFPASRPWLGLTGIAAIFTAILSMQASTGYDSGLYHFNSIRWLNEYPIVLGLGNLHSRLAFNQSFFVYAAQLNLYPLFKHGHNIANGFLIFLLSAECLFILSNHVTKRDKAAGLPPGNLFAIFVIPVIIYLALYTNISSPAPDITAYLLQILIFIHFIRDIDEYSSVKNDDARMLFIFSMSASAITVKISSLVFAAAICLLLLISRLKYWRLTPKQAIIKIIKMTALPAFIMMIWSLRGILISGCPLYPSTLGCIKTAWAVPTELVQQVADVIYSWSRVKRASPENVLSSWDWLTPWFHTVVLGNKSLFIYPLIIAGLCLMACLILRFRGQLPKALNKNIFLIPVPILTGLIFWFFTAPGFRFIQALVLILPIATAAILISIFKTTGKLRNAAVIAMFLIVNINIVWAILEDIEPLTEISIQSFRPVKTVRLIKNTTLSGLAVFSPKKDDQCWDSELPCTPEFRAELEFDDNNFFPEFRLAGGN